MIKLKPIFASHALFQAGSVLTVSGETDATGRARVCILDENGHPVSVGQETAVRNGVFSADVETPPASFRSYAVSVTCGDDTVTLSDVLFGEVWLAAGQSNMEFYNSWVTGYEDAVQAAQGRAIRFFFQTPLGGNDYPIEEQPMREGTWYDVADTEGIGKISAIGFSFAVDLYDRLRAKDGVGVPVGILNDNVGATSIYSWLPHHSLDALPDVMDLLREINMDDGAERWNTRDLSNRSQFSAQYNAMMCCIVGARVRGVLWYQGENECNDPRTVRAYQSFWEIFAKTYESLFAADPARFTVLPILLYKWTYGAGSECHVGALNTAFVRAARKDPAHLSFVPIDDIPGSWVCFGMNGNHPIHPARKYEVGRRCAQLAMTNAYGADGQKQPAALKKCHREGGSLVLTFESVGTGLYTLGKMPRGLYVRGQNTEYLPAAAEVLTPDTLRVWCDEITEPLHVCYAMQSMQSETGLFAGDYPVAPFATEDMTDVTLEQRDYCDMTREARWIFNKSADVNDCFMQPVWRPLPGCAVCRDTGEILHEPLSLHVNGDECTGEFGVAVKSYRYHRLDFDRFAGMTFNYVGRPDMHVTLALVYPSQTITVPVTVTKPLTQGWKAALADWSDVTLPAEEMLRFEIRFSTASLYRVANLESIRLLPIRS